MSGDGRLDLDDLGEVIDHASVLDDQPRAEVLDDGNGPGWAERLEDAGITPWARRHRRPLSVAAVAVLVVAAGAIAYPRLVPPPVDPELRVRATPVAPTQNQDDTGGGPVLADQVGIFSSGQTLRAAYALTKDSADDTATYRIDGLVGPAIRASSASPQTTTTSGAAPTEVARADVDVVVDCFDGTPLPVAEGTYFLDVTRTDALGRTTSGRIPVDNASVQWPQFVSASCLQTQAAFALTPTAVRTTVDRAARTVTADVDVTNAFRVPATLSVDPVYGSTPLVTSMTPVSLLPQSSTTLQLTMELRDCNQPAVQFVGRPTVAGSTDYDSAFQGVYLTADVGSAVVDPILDPTGSGGRAQMPLVFPPTLARSLDEALGTICTGGPEAVGVEVTGAGPGRKVTAPFSSGNPEATRIPVTFVVTTDGAERVRVALPPLAANESETARLRPASATARDGRAVLRTELDVDCAGGFVPPPTLQLEITTARGTFPRQTQIVDASLAKAIAGSCTTIGAQQLMEYGWEDATSAP